MQNEITSPKKAVIRRKTNLTVIVFVLLIISMVFFKIYNDVQLNELTTQNVKMKQQLENLHSEETRLQVLLEKRTDLREIEKRATEELGLKKIEKYQIEYVALPTKDKTFLVATKQDNDFLSSVTRGFSVLLEFLS